MEDITKIVKSLVNYGLLIKGATQTIENYTKNKRVDFFAGFKLSVSRS